MVVRVGIGACDGVIGGVTGETTLGLTAGFVSALTWIETKPLTTLPTWSVTT